MMIPIRLEVRIISKSRALLGIHFLHDGSFQWEIYHLPQLDALNLKLLTIMSTANQSLCYSI